MTAPQSTYADWKQWDAGEFGAFDGADASYFAAETGIAGGAGSRILELGFGNGRFIGWARSRGAQIWGVETDPVLVARAKEFLGGPMAAASVDDAQVAALSGSLTHIVAFDVIEHIPVQDIPALLRRCRNLLCADGRMILRFPNGDSPFGRMIQHGDPTHVTTMGRGKLEFLARTAGLRVLDIRAPALPIFGNGPVSAVKRALQRGGRGLIEPLIGLLYFGGRRIPLDQNYTATLGRDG